jgi:hypothetical protein
MRTPILVLAALSACFVSADTTGDSSLIIDNQSDYVIDEVHVAPVDSRSWGPNLVPEALFPGESIEIVVDCDVYDVLIVDELGIECVLAGIDLCFDSDVWVITNHTLDVCAFQ